MSTCKVERDLEAQISLRALVSRHMHDTTAAAHILPTAPKASFRVKRHFPAVAIQNSAGTHAALELLHQTMHRPSSPGPNADKRVAGQAVVITIVNFQTLGGGGRITRGGATTAQWW
jgi:hypothetical protein